MNMPRKPDQQPVEPRARNSTAREWTAVEKYKLKGFAKKAYPAEKIARALRRPVDATVAMASKLGLQLI